MCAPWQQKPQSSIWNNWEWLFHTVVEKFWLTLTCKMFLILLCWKCLNMEDLFKVRPKHLRLNLSPDIDLATPKPSFWVFLSQKFSVCLSVGLSSAYTKKSVCKLCIQTFQTQICDLSISYLCLNVFDDLKCVSVRNMQKLGNQ